jgi:hypothetical protein
MKKKKLDKKKLITERPPKLRGIRKTKFIIRAKEHTAR